jgi:hypothetical protein
MSHEQLGLRPGRVRKDHRSNKPLVKGRRRATYVSRVTPESADALILDYLEQLGSPRALHVWMLYKAGQHRDLVELKFDPSLYELVFSRTGISRLRSDYAATKFFSKCKNLKTLIDKKEVALAAAREAEVHCLETNEAIIELNSGRRVNDKLNTALFRASQIFPEYLVIALPLLRTLRSVRDVLRPLTAMKSLGYISTLVVLMYIHSRWL